MSRRVDRIVSGLGHYFGVIAKDGFVSLLLSDENAFAGGFFTPPDPSTDVEVASLLMDITEGGLTTPMLLDDIAARVAGSDGDTSNLKNVVKICYEPHGDWTTDPSKVLLTTVAEDNPPDQGAPGSSSDAYSIRAVGGLSDESLINMNTGRPAPGMASTMSIIQVLASKYSPANRDTGALSLFLNAMPSLEMSRAVPFLDLVLIQEGEMLEPTGLDDGKARLSKLSLGQFLMGNAVVNNTGAFDPQAMVLGAKDGDVINEQEHNPDFTTENEDGDTVAATFSTAGMEMFTAPQTLVNADENHFEYDPPNNYTENVGDPPPAEQPFPDPRRAAAIIDKFRPLMSIKSFNLNVIPTGGMMSYKSGKIKLVLHDRSRLAEVATFVRPSMMRSTHFLIEYGWAHPDAKVHAAPTSADPGILFGEFIGSLRSREKYAIVNSSFSFDEVGQVEIELQLSMLSSRAANNIQIGMGENSKAEFQKVKDLTNMIASIRGRMDSSMAAAIGGDGDILGALSSPSGAMNLDEDTIKAIRRIRVAASNSDNSTLNELGGALTQLTSGGVHSAAGALARSISEEIRAKMDVLKSMGTSGDPFFMAVDKESNDIRMPTGSTQTYVSLGKLLATFVGVPVCSAGFYDDVQILCYNFNEKASYMRNRNIATFPIPIADLKTELEKALESIMNMTIQGFIGFMNTYFLSDQAAPAYGFQGMYKSRDDEDRSQRQLNSQFEEDSAALFSKEQTILKHAYNNEAGGGAETSLEFKMPTLQMYMETVPCLTTPTGGGAAKTILRIHIFDSQNSSYSSLKAMLDAVQDKSLGMITPAAIAASREGSPSPEEIADVQTALQKAVDQGLLEIYPPTTGTGTGAFENGQRYRIKGGLPNIKAFLMNSMPSVRYGQEASGIISANLASMSDPAMTTVNMMRNSGGPEDPVGARQSGLPMRVAPMQLSLETIGCPIWNFGQQLFIDFGTGTTVDNIYAVVGIDHSITSGEFKSKVKLVQLDSYGKFESLVDVVNDAVVAIEGVEDTTE